MGDPLSDVEAILPRLSAAERMVLIEKLAKELPPSVQVPVLDATGIDVDPAVCGGEPRIVRTRIPVWLLEQARRLGKTDDELLAAYPTLRPDDLRHAWAYVAGHADEIEQQIKENEAA